MLQYRVLFHCIVSKQVEAVYKTDKQTSYIAKVHKTEIIKNIDTLVTVSVSRYTSNIAILRYIDTYRTSLEVKLCYDFYSNVSKEDEKIVLLYFQGTT